MAKNRVSIAIMGLGNVGKNFLSILDRQSSLISDRTGCEFIIAAASDSRHSVLYRNGIQPGELLDLKSGGDISMKGQPLRAAEMFASSFHVLVDMSTASPDGKRERDVYVDSMETGKDIVTANKSPLANHWSDIMGCSRQQGKSVLFEATVAGGVPLFSLLKYSCGPSRLVRFRGIVSLTANFVLRKMGEGLTFERAVRMAQELGIAETNYTDDTGGVDAARKTVILANALFGLNLRLAEFKFQGITSCAATEDSSRLITEIVSEPDGTKVFSGIRKLDTGDFLASFGEMSLGYEVETEFNGKLRISSVSDGPVETAAAVVNDLMLLAGQKFQGKPGNPVRI